jgi:hypothetical protein
MWRDLLRRLGRYRPGRQVSTTAPEEPDRWNRTGRPSLIPSHVLDQIERTALDVYAGHGLPTRPGHYRRGRRARSWTFLGDDLTPEARWAAMLERPPEDGWRYRALADLGRGGPPELHVASTLLARCTLLRSRLAGAGLSDPLDDMEMAIRLGADWRALEAARARIAGGRLQLTAPHSSRSRRIGKTPLRVGGPKARG